MLVLPMFAEQARNARLILHLNIGNVLNKFLLSKKHIFDGLNHILLNSNQFVKRVSKFHNMLLDRPIADLDDGLFYLNRLIKRSKLRKTNNYRRKNVEEELFFRRKGIDLYFVEYIFYELLFTVTTLAIFLSK